MTSKSPEWRGVNWQFKLRTNPIWRPLLIIAMTAMSNEENCLRISNAAFDMHLIKPVSPTMLIEVTNRLFQVAESHGLRKHHQV